MFPCFTYNRLYIIYNSILMYPKTWQQIALCPRRTYQRDTKRNIQLSIGCVIVLFISLSISLFCRVSLTFAPMRTFVIVGRTFFITEIATRQSLILSTIYNLPTINSPPSITAKRQDETILTVWLSFFFCVFCIPRRARRSLYPRDTRLPSFLSWKTAGENFQTGMRKNGPERCLSSTVS